MPWMLGSIGSPVVWSRPTTLPLSCSDCKRTRKSPVLPQTSAETGQQSTPQFPMRKFFTVSVSSAFVCLTPHFALHEKMNYAKENGNKPEAWSKHPECQDQSYRQEFWELLAMHPQKLPPQVAHAATDKFITLAQSTEYEHKHLILHSIKRSNKTLESQENCDIERCGYMLKTTPWTVFLTTFIRCCRAATSKAPAPWDTNIKVQGWDTHQWLWTIQEIFKYGHFSRGPSTWRVWILEYQGFTIWGALLVNSGLTKTIASSSIVFFTALRPSRTASLICAIVWSFGPVSQSKDPDIFQFAHQ